MISLLLPVGDYSFFVRACIGNIFETCGAEHDLDLVLLLSQSTPDHVYQQIEVEQLTYNFRVLTAPFKTRLHLDLLNWAIHNDTDMQDWFMVQHSDLMWTKNGWLKLVQKAVETHSNDICVSCTSINASAYTLDNNVTLPQHDYVGIFHRERLVENKFNFMWGSLPKLKPSPTLLEVLSQNRIAYKNTGVIIDQKAWVDGTKLIQLEMCVRFPERQHHIPLMPFFFHPWEVFRVLFCTKIKNDHLVINFGKNARENNHAMHCIADASYVSSMLLDRDEITDPIPWLAFRYLEKSNNKYWDKCKWRFEKFQKYANPDNIIGSDDALGLNYINHLSKEIRLPWSYKAFL